MKSLIEENARFQKSSARAWTWIAFALAAGAISACDNKPAPPAAASSPKGAESSAVASASGASSASGACTSGSAVAPGALYAVYQGAGDAQVEDLKGGASRCIRVITAAPDAASSGAISAQTPQCSAGTVAVVANTKFASYFGEDKDQPLQIEDLRGAPARCITPAAKAGAPNGCTPPKRERVIDGTRYCIG